MLKNVIRMLRKQTQSMFQIIVHTDRHPGIPTVGENL
jgi:hypothetical protein